ncbi:MAG: tetratricopeptide repeat protein [Saprospiraceae bacterium]|nr:tetratricopeptide repeat protein [Saprospiraceae bacterium]
MYKSVLSKMKLELFICIALAFIRINIISGQSNQCPKADSLMINQQYLMALENYGLCYERDTTDKRNLASMANCLYLLGDYQKAKEYYHVLENLEGFSSDAIIRLASIYETQQNLPKAVKYNLKLTGLYPSNPVYLRKLGSLYLQGNEKTQAMQSYQAALELNSRDLLTIQGLAEMLIGMDEINAADSLLKLGLETDSTHIGLSLLLSRVKYKLRDYEAVTEILHKLTYQTELNNYYNKLLGYAFLQVDSVDKSIYHLQKSLLNEGDPEYALFYMALAYEKKKEFEKSMYFYNEAIKAGISENLDQYYRGLARINTQNGDFKAAIDNYNSCLQYSWDPLIYYYMGNAAEQYYKDKSKAIKYYEQYLNAKPTDKLQAEIAIQRVKVLKELRFMKGKSK